MHSVRTETRYAVFHITVEVITASTFLIIIKIKILTEIEVQTVTFIEAKNDFGDWVCDLVWEPRCIPFFKEKRLAGVIQFYEWSIENKYHITICWDPIGQTELASGSMILGATTSRRDRGNGKA